MKAVHFYKPSVSRWLRSILATTALGCSALAQWPTITLEVPVQAAGHSFELYEGYYYGSSSVFSGLPTYDALTQKFLITAGANGSTWYYPRLWNNTLGIETTVNLGQYDYYNPPASIPVNPIGNGSMAFAIAEELEGHTFALVVPAYNWSFPVSKLPVLGYSGVGGDGNPAFVSLGFFNAYSNTQMNWLIGANDAVLVDLTAQKQSAPSTTDLRNPSSWVPKTVFVPTREVTFDFGPANWNSTIYQWANYTLHTSSGSQQNLIPSVIWITDPITNLSEYRVRVSGQVGVGENYWLTTSSETESTGVFFMDAGISNVVQSTTPMTIPASNYQTMTFMIGQNHYYGLLGIMQDGVTSSISIDWSNAWQNRLVSWDANGVETQYYFSVVSAAVDVNRPWSLVKAVDPTQQYMEWYSYGAITDLRDGFSPFNLVPPVGSVSIAVPEVRRDSLLNGQIFLKMYGTTWAVTADPDFQAPGTYLTYWSVMFEGTPMEHTSEFHYIPATALASSLYDGDLHYATLKDEIVGDETYSGQLGDVLNQHLDFSRWLPEVPLNLNLPESRWTQELYVITAAGGMFPVVKGSIQGLWSSDGTNSYFTSYHYFDATSKMHLGADWWVYAPYGNWGQPAYSDMNGLDIDGNPSLLNWTPESDMTDSDNDGLPNGWEGRWFGNLSSTGTQNPDGDDWDNATELANGTNPIDAAPVITLTSPAGAMLVN